MVSSLLKAALNDLFENWQLDLGTLSFFVCHLNTMRIDEL